MGEPSQATSRPEPINPIPEAVAGIRDDNPLRAGDLCSAIKHSGSELNSIINSWSSRTRSSLIKDLSGINWEDPNKRLTIREYTSALAFVSAIDKRQTTLAETSRSDQSARELGGLLEGLGNVADLADEYELRRHEIETLGSAWGELEAKVPLSPEPEVTYEFLNSLSSDLVDRSEDSESIANWLKAGGYEQFDSAVGKAADQILSKYHALPWHTYPVSADPSERADS